MCTMIYAFVRTNLHPLCSMVLKVLVTTVFSTTHMLSRNIILLIHYNDGLYY